MPPSPEALRRYKRQIAVYRDRTSALLVAEWDRLDGHDEADIATYARRTAPGLAGAKSAAVSLSAGFYALATGTRPRAVRADDIDRTPDIAGPFRATWHALSMNRPMAEALTVGRSTAEAVGFDFVQSVARRTGDLVADERTRWRRVPGGMSCAWCLDVAGQSYSSAEAADFGHERCDCDAVPE